MVADLDNIHMVELKSDSKETEIYGAEEWKAGAIYEP